MLPVWITILDQVFGSGRTRKYTIAKAITAAIRNNKLQAGSLMPTIRRVAAHLNMSKSVVEGVWALLKKDALIHARVGHGTYISAKPDKATGKHENETAKALFVGRAIYFNKGALPIDNSIMQDLHRELIKGYTTGVMTDSMKNMPEILTGIGGEYTRVLNLALSTAYKTHELYYSQSYEQMINQICQVLVRPHKIVVMADTASLAMRNTVAEAGFEVRLVRTDQDGMIMECLEEILITGRVQIVYIRSRSLLPFKQFLSNDRMLTLLGFEQKYGFYIIEDDRYGCFYRNQTHLLMEKGYKKKTRIIYISSLSCMHPELNEVNLVVARAKISGAIIKHFKHAGHILRVNMICSINRLLENKIILKSENKFGRQLRKVMMVARGLLVKSDLWDYLVLDAYEGWFFYLRLKHGYFPEQVHALLANERIFVMNCAEYEHGCTKENSIVISMADYLDPVYLNEDINRLNNVIKKYVIIN